MSDHTPGPLAWQQFGDKWCLTGQYGMRPIVLSVGRKGELQLRDAAADRLIPFSPDHPDARLLAAAPDLLEALKVLVTEFAINLSNPADWDVDSISANDLARAAIAKAQPPQPA